MSDYMGVTFPTRIQNIEKSKQKVISTLQVVLAFQPTVFQSLSQTLNKNEMQLHSQLELVNFLIDDSPADLVPRNLIL